MNISVQEQTVVEATGLDVHVDMAGSGSAVLVVHHSTGPLWSPFLDALAGRHRVLAPDVPGYGRSARPDQARRPAQLATLLHRALDGLGIDAADGVDAVGLGFGGFLCAEMVAAAPRRFRTLTLVGAAGLRPRVGDIHDPMMESWTSYVRRGFHSGAAFDALFGAEPAPEIVDGWDRSREMTARVTWRPWMWDTFLPDALRGIDTPTLLVWGDDDRIVPIDCAHQYAEAIDGARLEIVPACGHAVDLERPDHLATLVGDFIDAHA